MTYMELYSKSSDFYPVKLRQLACCNNNKVPQLHILKPFNVWYASKLNYLLSMVVDN